MFGMFWTDQVTKKIVVQNRVYYKSLLIRFKITDMYNFLSARPLLAHVDVKKHASGARAKEARISSGLVTLDYHILSTLAFNISEWLIAFTRPL